MKNCLPLVCLLVCCTCFISPQQASAQRFGLGFTLGGNLSQIDGDQLFGYRKFGFQAGMIGTATLHDRSYISVEMLYSNRGSMAGNSERNIALQRLSLHYVEVPFLVHYKFAQDWDEEYRLDIHGGFSYSRLLDSQIDTPNQQDATNYNSLKANFNKNNFSLLAGITFYLRPDLGLTLRQSYGLNKLDNTAGFPEELDNLREYWLSLRLMYLFK